MKIYLKSGAEVYVKDVVGDAIMEAYDVARLSNQTMYYLTIRNEEDNRVVVIDLLSVAAIL